MPATISHWHRVTREIVDLFTQRGDSQYGGEAVTQLEHALQAAFFAERQQLSNEHVVAALLHDIGHLLHDLPDDAPEHDVDDRHEELAAEWLRSRFGPAVVEPVQLHVAAKRYLCAIEPSYLQQLSAPSVLSLRLQGGPMTELEARTFEAAPFFESSVALRRCDDAAKVPQLKTKELSEYLPLIEKVARAFDATR